MCCQGFVFSAKREMGEERVSRVQFVLDYVDCFPRHREALMESVGRELSSYDRLGFIHNSSAISCGFRQDCLPNCAVLLPGRGFLHCMYGKSRWRHAILP